MHKNHACLISLSSAFFVSVISFNCFPVYAQSVQQSETALSSSRQIEEVLVTARRTTENLQDVPVAVSTMSGSALQRENIRNPRDLQGRVPSLVVSTGSQFRNTMAPTIRGQGASFNASPGVVQYFAEVPLPTDSFTTGQGGPGMLFDLESIQILKGPQGTLFGRNTTGGAMVMAPAKPTNQLGGYISAERGNYDNLAQEAVFNIPLVDDRFLARLSLKSHSREGYTHDIANGKDYDNIDYRTARLGLTWRFSEQLENTLIVYTTKRDENGPGAVISAVNPIGVNETVMRAFLGIEPPPLVAPEELAGCAYVNAFTGSSNCGQDIVDEQLARDIRHVEHSANTADELVIDSSINTLSWDYDDNLSFKSITSQTRYRRRFGWDQDGSRMGFNDVSPTEDYSSNTEMFTQELQAQGNGFEGALTYVVGLYYEDKEPRSLQKSVTVSLFQSVLQTYAVETTSYGPYAQANYDLGRLSGKLGGLNLTAGVRHTTDKQEGQALLMFLGNGTPLDGRKTERDFTWLLGLDYRVASTLLYGKISRGYKSGGFSPTVANPANFSFGPEYVTSYELGSKSEFMLGNMPIRLNLAAYHTDYKDMHKSVMETWTDPDAPTVSLPAIGAATLNVGESWIHGAEMELTVRPTDRLTITATYTYTDAEYEDFKVPVGSTAPLLDCSGERKFDGAIGDFSCVPFSDILEDQFSITANYNFPMDNSVGVLEASLSYSWQSERYTGTITLPEDEPGAWLEDVGLWNASLSWNDIFNSAFSIQIYGSNLADKEYRMSNSNVWNQLFFQASLWSEPRMYGARLIYRWGN